MVPGRLPRAQRSGTRGHLYRPPAPPSQLKVHLLGPPLVRLGSLTGAGAPGARRWRGRRWPGPSSGGRCARSSSCRPTSGALLPNRRAPSTTLEVRRPPEPQNRERQNRERQNRERRTVSIRALVDKILGDRTNGGAVPSTGERTGYLYRARRRLSTRPAEGGDRVGQGVVAQEQHAQDVPPRHAHRGEAGQAREQQDPEKQCSKAVYHSKEHLASRSSFATA